MQDHVIEIAPDQLRQPSLRALSCGRGCARVNRIERPYGGLASGNEAEAQEWGKSRRTVDVRPIAVLAVTAVRARRQLEEVAKAALRLGGAGEEDRRA